MENQTQDSILDLNFTMTTKEIFNGQNIFYEGRKKYLTRINIIFVLLLFSFIGSLAYVITAINSNDPDYVFIVIYSILSVRLFILCLFYGFSVIMNIQKKVPYLHTAIKNNYYRYATFKHKADKDQIKIPVRIEFYPNYLSVQKPKYDYVKTLSDEELLSKEHTHEKLSYYDQTFYENADFIYIFKTALIPKYQLSNSEIEQLKNILNHKR